MDAMSFIFRAYHAMARQRAMSTKSGLPTAAIYVFVNMLRKLRDDFAPEFLAAVFDVSGPTFRDEQAETVTTVRKFDIKTQTFTEVEYKGYKANRAAMPEDLAQQVPYIRRALEAYRIPILEVARFEADDVIGTLARKAAEATSQGSGRSSRTASAFISSNPSFTSLILSSTRSRSPDRSRFSRATFWCSGLRS